MCFVKKKSTSICQNSIVILIKMYCSPNPPARSFHLSVYFQIIHVSICNITCFFFEKLLSIANRFWGVIPSQIFINYRSSIVLDLEKNSNINSFYCF